MEKEKIEGIDEIIDIKIEPKPEEKPLKKCLICGKETTGDVCSPEHQKEWIRRKDEEKLNEKVIKMQKMEEEKIKPTKQETKELIQETNQDPIAKRHGIKTMKKSTYIMLWAFAGIFLILFTTNMIWQNTNLGNFVESQMNKTDIEINTPITVNSPDIPITNNYETQNNNTVNVDIDFGDFAQKIADEVIDMINNTNFTQ